MPKGRSRGMEIEATAFLTPGFEVFSSLGWLDSEITDAGVANPEIDGNEFNYAPSLTAGLGFRKTFDAGWFFGANASHVDSYYSEIDNDPARKAGGYTVANVNAGYAARQYTVRAYVNNVTDEDVLYFQASNLAQVGAPRTTGIILDYRF